MIIFLIVGLIIFSTFSALNGFSIIASIATAISSLGTLILLYLTKQSLEEMREKRELEERPVVSIKVKPDHKNSTLLYFVIQNTGGGPAYDVSIKFTPDIKYNNSTLNNLDIFNRIPIIAKNESIEFFFDTSYEILENDEPNKTRAKISCFKQPKENLSKETISDNKITREVDVLFEQRKNTLQVSEKGIDDLVEEITELRQGLLLLLWEFQDTKRIKEEDVNDDK